MRSATLNEEFETATAAVRREDFDYLIAQGVSRAWLWGGPMRFGAICIITSGATYEPVEHGRPAYIVPANPLSNDVVDEDVADLIAWCPDDPGKWWCRCGTM